MDTATRVYLDGRHPLHALERLAAGAAAALSCAHTGSGGMRRVASFFCGIVPRYAATSHTTEVVHRARGQIYASN